MSDITRRQALGRLATAFAVSGAIDRLAARDLHAQVQASSAAGPYAPRALSARQFHTLERLTDLIIPVEEGRSGAVEAGVAPWIDALLAVNDELKSSYVTGLTWLDTTMTAQHGSDFASTAAAQQMALLDVIAFKKNRTPENATGVDFFILARRMTVDGFYTSDVGLHEIIPQGRPPFGAFVVPQEDIDYVLSLSPFT